METTPLQNALRQNDLAWLRRYVRRSYVSPEELSLFFREERAQHIALLYLRESLYKIKQRSVLMKYAALLPGELPGAPEAQLLLAELYLQLWTWREEKQLPRWREAALSAVVQIAWRRTEILVDPTTLGLQHFDEVSLQAVKSIRPADVLYPPLLLTELAKAPEYRYQSEALSLLKILFQAAALSPKEAMRVLLLLLSSPFEPIVGQAFTELTAPWARLDEPPKELEQALLERAPSLSSLRCAARWRFEDLLLKTLRDEAAPLALRREALSLFGGFAPKEAIEEMLFYALSDPTLFGESLISFLQGLHRRGEFLPVEQLPSLLSLYLSCESISATDLARLVFTVRHPLIERLSALDASDASWGRFLPLIEALGRGPQGARKLPLGPMLAEKLLKTKSDTLGALFLRSLSVVGDEAQEEAVLSVLERFPFEGLRALQFIGGAKTKERLRENLTRSLEGEGEALWLGPDRERALVLLWQLSSEEERRALLSRLEPRRLPAELKKSFGAKFSEEEKQLLLYSSEITSAADHLRATAKVGGAGSYEVLRDLLLRLVTEIAAGETVNESEQGEERRTLPESVIASLKEYGRRLYTQGEIRPRCLLSAREERSAGEAVFVDLCLSLLQRRDLAEDETCVLLRALRTLSSPVIFPGIYYLLREEDPHLRKLMLGLLAKEGAEAVSINLVRLTGAEDIQTLRQALLALGRSNASWAAETIAACLDHSNMNMKKAAAEALCEAGAPEAVPKMLYWLGTQDNVGLRASLIDGLKRILGDGYPSTVLAAIDATQEARRQDLLLSALQGELRVELVRRVILRDGAASLLLLQKLSAGTLVLSSGSLDSLALELARFGRKVPSRREKDIEPRPSVNALRERGWNIERALEVASQHRQEPLSFPEKDAVKRFLLEWLSLAKEQNPEHRRAALGLIAELAPFNGQEMSLLASNIEPLLQGLSLEPLSLRESYLSLIESILTKLTPLEALLVAEVLREVKIRPKKGGRSFLALLRLCGVLLTRKDVEVALSFAEEGADPRGDQLRVLQEAFGSYGNVSVPEGLRALLVESLQGGKLPEKTKIEGAASLNKKDALSRVLLRAYSEVLPLAPKELRGVLLDCLEELQPIGAPAWMLHEESPKLSKIPAPSDYDQPRNVLHQKRLLDSLEDKEEAKRRYAAEQLLQWPNEEIRARVLPYYLQGKLALPASSTLAASLLGYPMEEIEAICQEKKKAARVSGLLWCLPKEERRRFASLFVRLWQDKDPEMQQLAFHALASIEEECVFETIWERASQGEWGLLSLIREPVIETPPRRALWERLRAAGHPAAKTLKFSPDFFEEEGKREEHQKGKEHLRERRTLPKRSETPKVDLFAQARGKDPEAARSAMSTLALRPTPEVTALFVELVESKEARVRLHAHRLLRACAPREEYLSASVKLLDDPLSDVQRSAIRSVSFGKVKSAAPKIVEMLTHPDQAVRRAAEEGVRALGKDSIGALKRAQSLARPDKREVYTSLLTKLGFKEEA